MSLTREQQQAAHAPGSVAVTAGAGTGKTHMLAERCLFHLCQQGLSPLQVVAVTFTEKAAAELRLRIRQEVFRQVPDRPDLLAELEAAPIGTIHALAARICREHPEASGAPLEFIVLDELEGSLWCAERLDEALNRFPEHIFEQIPYSMVRSAVIEMLADPIAAERALNRGTDFWQDRVASARQSARDDLLSNPEWQVARAILNAFAGDPDDRIEQERRTALQGMAALEQDNDPETAFELLNAIKLTGGSRKKWPAGGLDDVKEAIKQLREAIRNIQKDGLLTLALGPADDALKAIRPVLREAFESARAYLDEAKKRSRLMDFADLEVHALLALESPEVRDYYAERWKAYLVDEYQDTNPVQIELLEKLTQEATVTIVGDEKQSIYSFRRADLIAARGFRERILAQGGREVALVRSFRAHAELVTTINQLFEPILQDFYRPIEARRAQAPHPGPHLRAYVVEAEKGGIKFFRQRVEARHIARLLRDMRDQGLPVHDKPSDTLRPVRPGDIAILSRTWGPLDLYGEALSALEIPSVLGGGTNLLATREAKDARALLRFLADPTDDLSLAAILRSPYFAVSDPVLFNFAQALPPKTSWWKGMQETVFPELAGHLDVLAELVRARHAELPGYLLQVADRLTGYSAVIANLPGAPRREADYRGFLDLVRQLERGTGDVFIVERRLRQLEAAEVEVPRPHLEAGNAVALMTIHAAKGLEWPVVVVPDLDRPYRDQARGLHFDPEMGVALQLEDEHGETQKPVLYTLLEQRQKERADAETKRLLYVALTRARDHLILTSAGEKGKALERLITGLDAAGIPVQQVAFAPEEAVLPPLPAPALLPMRELRTKPVGSGLFELPVTALSEYARCPRRFRFRFLEDHPGLVVEGTRARQVGKLAHWALEHNVRDIATLARFDASLPLQAVEEALDLARRFHSLPDYAPFRGDDVQREYSVTLSIKRLTLNGVIDLLGPDFVLDFKTDREVIPEHHRFQLWAYAEAAKREKAHIAYLRHNFLHTYRPAELQATGEEAEHLVRRILDEDYSARPSRENCRWCPYAEICDERFAVE